jgi:two-component system, NtrC family, nitrogen regulation response regulator GlnG
MKRILVADDDASIRLVLSQALSKEGFEVRATGTVATLAKWIRDGEGDAVITDVMMGDENVLDSLPRFTADRPKLPIVVISGRRTIETAMGAAKGGAYEYLPKPFDLEELIALVHRSLVGDTPKQMKERALFWGGEGENAPPDHALSGSSEAMQGVYRALARVVGTTLPVLLQGEVGTGKARAARALHDMGRRKRGPFVFKSIGGLSVDGLEKELKESFVSARSGTLVLDHLDSLSREGQVALLRLLQSDGLEDIRFVAISHHPLEPLVESGDFREDLFWRMAVIQIQMPPLRDRMDDLPDLLRSLLRKASQVGIATKTFSTEAIGVLKAHSWPGNIRELESIVMRLATFAAAPAISKSDVEMVLTPRRLGTDSGGSIERDAGSHPDFNEILEDKVFHGRVYDLALEKLEGPLIEATLRLTNGNQIRAAAILGLNRNTLRKKIQTLGLKSNRED